MDGLEPGLNRSKSPDREHECKKIAELGLNDLQNVKISAQKDHLEPDTVLIQKYHAR
jgi:hypothetical protein